MKGMAITATYLPVEDEYSLGFNAILNFDFWGTAYVSNDLLIIVSAVSTYALRKFWIEDGINNVTRGILGYAEVSIYIILKSSSCTYSGNTDSLAMLEQFWIKATYFPLASMDSYSLITRY